MGNWSRVPRLYGYDNAVTALPVLHPTCFARYVPQRAANSVCAILRGGGRGGNCCVAVPEFDDRGFVGRQYRGGQPRRPEGSTDVQSGGRGQSELFYIA